MDLDVHSRQIIDFTSDNEEDDKGTKILIDFWVSSIMIIGDNQVFGKYFQMSYDRFVCQQLLIFLWKYPQILLEIYRAILLVWPILGYKQS